MEHNKFVPKGCNMHLDKYLELFINDEIIGVDGESRVVTFNNLNTDIEYMERDEISMLLETIGHVLVQGFGFSISDVDKFMNTAICK